MNDKYMFSIGIAGLKINFIVPKSIEIPSELRGFLVDIVAKVDAEYEIVCIDKPLKIEKTKKQSYRGMDVYSYKDGQLRVYTQLVEQDGCQVACYTNREQKNILYYPEKKWRFYAKELHFLHLIAIEELLLQKSAFLLHSSFVEINGYTVLFSGESGIGKSTQATLWKKHLGADILNGDRCVIRELENEFYGCGSPWAGTSGIYRKEMAPIKGIFILKQSKENKVRRLKAEAFSKLYQQSIVNEWNSEFVTGITDLIVRLLGQVPVYELSCRPDEEAVKLAYNTLFEGGI